LGNFSFVNFTTTVCSFFYLFSPDTVTTLSNYDVSKGVIVDETVKNDGDKMYKKVSYSGYQNKAGVWLPTTL